MKRIVSMCAAVAVILTAAVSCCNKAPKVTALVGGPEGEPVALVVEYASPVSAASLTPEAFVVPGREVVCVAVCDGKPCEAAPCDKPEGEPCAKPADEKCPKCKAGEPCPKEECKKECDKKEGKCELTVPEISVRQVAPITSADGKEIKPWKKDVKATAAAPAPAPRHHRRPLPPCGE